MVCEVSVLLGLSSPIARENPKPLEERDRPCERYRTMWRSDSGVCVSPCIDPRNGETFYVGKGRGNRIFQHVGQHVGGRPVTGAGDEDEEDASDLKLQRIKEIQAAQLEVDHVVHRHNIENPEVAFQIEAALIDAYPGLLNRAAGHGSGDYGCRHIDQIIASILSPRSRSSSRSF